MAEPAVSCRDFHFSNSTLAASSRFRLPLLQGFDRECLFVDATPLGQQGPWLLFAKDDWLLGLAAGGDGERLEADTHQAYATLFDVSAGWHLCRVWNYVPGINLPGAGGLENYRVFCRGRSLAFEERFGLGFKARLPAASAVGHDGSGLFVAFVASRRVPVHFENPLQTPSYDYPSTYGPRPPSFARATLLAQPDSARDLFVSGTAAVKGHRTVCVGDTLGQLEHTLENMESVCRVAGLAPGMGAGRAVSRYIKVYLRNEGELGAVAEVLEKRLISEGDRVSYLRSDICRQDLNIEIELSLLGLS